MRYLLLRPVIFVSLVLGLFIIAELIAIGGLTWRNHQRLSILANDISNGHRLEEAVFLLLKNQLQQDSISKENESNIIHPDQDKLLMLLHSENINDPEILADVKLLKKAFDKALKGDNKSLVNAIETTRHLFYQHTRGEEILLAKIAEDSQLEFELSVVIPLITFCIIFLIGRYFFKRHILAPLDSLKELLQKLVRGDRHPIQLIANDPLIKALFANYNLLVIRLNELEKEHLDYTTELEHKIRETTSELFEKSHQIARSERLSVVAELAASTAHELRNPLAGIQLALENILQECDDDDLLERINAIYFEVKRLTQHLNDLLALTKSSPKSLHLVDINKVCDELKHFLKYQLPENIDLIYEIDPRITHYLPENEFRLALLNLLLNALHAIDNKSGQIRLTVKHHMQQIIISVEDTGTGFTQNFLEHGIQPFISLKAKGTGLGLAMVQRFIKSQQGTIKLSNNTDGHGCVTLTLPILES